MFRKRSLVLGVHAIERAVPTSVTCLEDCGWLAAIISEWVRKGNRIVWFGYETKLYGATPTLRLATTIWESYKFVRPCTMGGKGARYENAQDYMEDALGRGFLRSLPHFDALLITGSRIRYEELAVKWLLMEYCAEKGIPCFFWDLDFTLPRNPIKEHKESGFIKGFPINFMPEKYLRSVMKKIVYLASITDYERAGLDIYNPVEWHGFFDWGHKRPIRAEHDYQVVYVGSTDNRIKHFKYWYSALKGNFKLDVWGGRHSEDLMKSMNWATWHGAVNPIYVPDVLNRGRVCIQSAREIYRKLGWQTFRIGECIMAGCILISPSDVLGIEKFIGSEFVFCHDNELLAIIDVIMGLSYHDYVEAVRYQRRLISGQSPQHRVARLENMVYGLNPALP